LRKLSNLEELSGLILPLASPDLDYMIDGTITVDGGVYALARVTRRMARPMGCQKKGGWCQQSID
jgi:hypothetical protein